MNPSGISTEPHTATRALPYSKGKASQWPAFTPVQPSPLGLIRHPTSDNSATHRTSHLWQGDIGSGPFDFNVPLQPVWGLQ